MKEYQSLRKSSNRATLLFTLLGAITLVQLAASATGIGHNYWTAIELIHLPPLAAATTGFLLWINRASQNLPRIGARYQKYNSREAVGWWFCPIICLFRPYAITKEIWRGSHPKLGAEGLPGWTKSPTPMLFPAWWATFWTSNLALTNASSGGLTAGYSNALPITGNVISLVSLILIVIIIRKISANQDRKYSAHRELIQREEENHKRERDTPAKRMIMLRNLLAREDPEIAEKASRGAWLELTPNQRNTVFDTFQKEWKKLDVEQTAARTSVEIAEAMTHTDTTQTELAKMQERAARQIARGLATNNARRFRRGINRAQRIREATASQANSINPNRQTNRNWGRYTPGPRLAVPVIIVIAALGSIAYWQGLPPFGPSGPGTQAVPLPAGTNQQDTETAPPPTAAATAAVPTPTLAETPTETPAPTAEPTSTSTPRRAPVRAPPPPLQRPHGSPSPPKRPRRPRSRRQRPHRPQRPPPRQRQHRRPDPSRSRPRSPPSASSDRLHAVPENRQPPRREKPRTSHVGDQARRRDGAEENHLPRAAE